MLLRANPSRAFSARLIGTIGSSSSETGAKYE